MKPDFTKILDTNERHFINDDDKYIIKRICVYCDKEMIEYKSRELIGTTTNGWAQPVPICLSCFSTKFRRI